MFPDWRGECVAIIASGPSVTKTDVDQLRDRIHVMAIKSNVDLAPWADAVYGCDDHWWMHRRGLPEFKGLKLTYGTQASGTYRDLIKIDINRDHITGDRLLTEPIGRVGSGGNSGFQALNLAVQFGATGVLLIGFDCYANGNSPHWYGRNDWNGCANPQDDNYRRWRRAFAAAEPRLKELGVDVVNASPKSTVGFRKASVAEALQGWGL